MSPRFKGPWRPSLFKLMLMVVVLVATEAAVKAGQVEEADPMEPCYLANNRASESLTISESTPVGTVVGEIMVNGDSSANGNIELSIRMPASNNLPVESPARQTVGTQRQLNGFGSTTTTTTTSLPLAVRRMGEPALRQGQSAKTARDLSSLIDLMPPLSIEHETKRLILAKKLDRENLDRYLVASSPGGYLSGSQSGSSSASLTVHVKCQLRQPPTVERAGQLNESSSSWPNSRSSILIPVHLIVTDENDNWPVFVNAPYIIDLNETAPSGSLLPGNEIVAVDGDQQGPLSTIEYSIVPGSVWSDSFGFLNPLDSRSLIVKDNRLLDYEAQSKLTLKVMARDQGEPPNWAITSLYVNVFDQDDLSPVFQDDKYAGFVRENRPGETIDLLPRRLMARDGDKTINAPVVYAFHTKTNHSIHFELDAELGRLSLKKMLPDSLLAHTRPFCLLVRAAQSDNPSRWTLSMINVRLSRSPSEQFVEQLLTDNQPPPVESVLTFAQSNYTVEISEAAAPGSIVLAPKLLSAASSRFGSATEPAEPAGDSEGVSYHLLDNELGYFKLDSRTGKLTLNRSLDYELHRHLTLRILATHEHYDSEPADSESTERKGNKSRGYPMLQCDITRVQVNVVNHNDHAPEFSHEQYNFQLSISDLIANFDLPKLQDQQQQQQQQQDNKQRSSGEMGRILSKRFGADLDLPGDEFAADDTLDWRAMLLGQVYCADRDYDDRVSLQLQGSKAQLFHLTQDGRLYLPLVNTSRLSVATRPGELTTINNQFAPSRFFLSASQRRLDHAVEHQIGRSREEPDRNYLNYLLSEFSNLGRLRLKVLASDSVPEPDKRRSTALIVISILSVDNFILQRNNPAAATHQQQQQPDVALVHLGNETSYDTAANKSADHSESRQVMMIPAPNGRSFVQINPDIVSNLILQGSRTQKNGSSSTDKTQDSLLASSSNQIGSQMSLASDGQQQMQRGFQPPSLLLVDDDGAKFVAMPAAIEVYNQQVQEAQDQQLERQRSALSAADSANSRSGPDSLWDRWKDRLGFASRESSGGHLYWINLSTAIMLHLIGVVVIFTLVTRYRSALAERNSLNDSSMADRWLSKRFPFLNSNSSSDDFPGSINPSSILNQQPSYANGGQSHVGKSAADARQMGARFAFFESHSSLAGRSFGDTHKSASYELDRDITDEGGRQQVSLPELGRMPVSCGVVVSAVSGGNQSGKLSLQLGKLTDLAPKCSDSPASCSSLSRQRQRQRQQSTELDESPRSLVQWAPPVESVMQSAPEVEADSVASKKCESISNKSSTFIGLQPSPRQSEEPSDRRATTVVAINIPHPSASSPQVAKVSSQQQQLGGCSSSSSVISLVSLSSTSISHKIGAAVEQRQAHLMNGCDVGQASTGSDVSSLDSNTLFNGIPTNRARPSLQGDVQSDHSAAVPPQPPPLPPPPPPSLVQAAVRLVETPGAQQAGAPLPASKPFSTRPSETRRPLPQNPQHLKLKQPAGGESMKRRTGFVTGKKSPLARSPSTAQRVGEQQQQQASPPTPPPLPPGGKLTGSGQTVSPTTSVDRGYESFQSYSSSSQTKPKQANGSPHDLKMASVGQQTSVPSGGGSSSSSPSSARSSSSPGKGLGRLLPAIPAPPAATTGLNKGRLGRQLQQQQQQTAPLQQSVRVAASRQVNLATAGKDLAQRRRASTAELGERGRGSVRINRSTRTLANSSVTNRVVSTGGRQHQRLSSGYGAPAARIGQRARSEQFQGSDDTEDDDFYYCYNKSQQAQLVGTLENYASHAYRKHPNGAQTKPHDLRELTASASMTGSQASKPPLRLYQPLGYQRHLRESAAKKQLTWSDQVGMS